MLLAQGVYAWEGAGVVSTELPDTGRYIATNSFPPKSLVLLTNLETEEVVEVEVYSRLAVPGGLLAEVSREAAAVIGLQNRSIGRIRLTSLSDPAVISRLSDDRLRSGDPDFDPQAKLKEAYGDEYPFGTGTIAVIPPPAPPPAPVPNNPMRSDPDSTWPPEPPIVVVPEPEPEPPIAVIPEPEPEPEPQPPVIVATPPEEPSVGEVIFLVPTGERPPPGSTWPPEPPIVVIPEPEPKPPAAYTPPTYTPPAPEPSSTSSAISGVNPVTRLEYGRYYLQIGASNDKSAVEWELSQLQHEYPVTILYMAATAYPYRILVGPVNQGEAGVLLKRLQSSGYKNAFLRKGE
jgi:hypothetical protein